MSSRGRRFANPRKARNHNIGALKGRDHMKDQGATIDRRFRLASEAWRIDNREVVPVVGSATFLEVKRMYAHRASD